MNQYLHYELDRAASEARKTQVWRVLAMRDKSLLGTIRWFGRWRQYTFFPEPGTTFNPDCLRSIAGFAADATSDQRRERAEATA